MRVPAPIAGEYYRLGTAVREKRMTVEQALKEIAQICMDRHEHFGLTLVPAAEAKEKEMTEKKLITLFSEYEEKVRQFHLGRIPVQQIDGPRDELIRLIHEAQASSNAARDTEGKS